MKIGENGKLSNFGIISAVIIGLVIGYFISRDTIADMITPSFVIVDSEGNSDAGIYKIWVTSEKQDEKSVEKIGKRILRELNKRTSNVNTAVIFFYKSESDYKENGIYNLACINFERDKSDLMSTKKGKYKQMYYCVEYAK